MQSETENEQEDKQVLTGLIETGAGTMIFASQVRRQFVYLRKSSSEALFAGKNGIKQSNERHVSRSFCWSDCCQNVIAVRQPKSSMHEMNAVLHPLLSQSSTKNLR